MFNLRQCWWLEVSTWPFTCSQSSHLWASVLCVFFPTSSSEQSLAVPLLLQLLSSLSSMPRKNPLFGCLSASLLSMTPTQDRGAQHILWSTQLCLSGGTVEWETHRATLWKRVGVYLIDPAPQEPCWFAFFNVRASLVNVTCFEIMLPCTLEKLRGLILGVTHCYRNWQGDFILI